MKKISINYSETHYYKLKFAETLMYRFLVSRDFKKALKLIDNIDSDYFDSYESKNYLQGFIFWEVAYSEDYKNEQNLKKAIDYLNKCISKKEPHYYQCKYLLS